MSKFFIFFILLWVLRSPLIALIVFLVILYFIDRRYVGLLPSIAKPIRRMRALSRLRQQLALSPHDVSVKVNIAKLLLEKKRYTEANRLLQEVLHVMDDSADVWSDLGASYLALGQLEEGERCMLEALERNPRVKYGEPYLRLGEAFSRNNLDKALDYLNQFRGINSSSCEAYYILGLIYRQIDRKDETRNAFTECIQIYKTLPKYKKRQERRWALRSWFRKTFA